MIDRHDASHDRLRLAVRRAVSSYPEGELFACLGDGDAILRTAAARELHVRGTRSAFEHATALTRHPRFDMREIAVFVLGQLGTPDCPFADQTFPLIHTLLDDPYREVRASAAAAVGSLCSLGRQPPEHVRARLLRMRDEDDAPLRANVAFALGMIPDYTALACLKVMRDDDDEGVRDAVEFGIEMHEERRVGSGSGLGRSEEVVPA